MSVEISGPKGYEVQYLITVWLALLGKLEGVECPVVMVEKVEDAELCLCISGSPLSIAMQSKNQSKPLSLDEFAEWLLHFSSQSGTDCLLGRVIIEPTRLALFVTKADCMDAVRPFVGPSGKLKPHLDVPLKKAELQNLSNALKSAASGGETNLTKQRAETARNLAAEILKPPNQTRAQKVRRRGA